MHIMWKAWISGVHSMEELCYCLKENAFLLDLSIMNDKLVDWIGEECKVWELAKQLYPMVQAGILKCVRGDDPAIWGMYDPEENCRWSRY